MNPVQFTDAAVEHIQNLMSKKQGAIGFRLSIKKTGCSGYAYVPSIIDTIVPADLSYQVQNNLTVYLDPECKALIKDVLVDYVVDAGPGLKQKHLVFINPNEAGRCGCGESFTV